MLCGTAVNIAMCLGSLGVSAPGGVVTQLGLTIIYRNEKGATIWGEKTSHTRRTCTSRRMKN